MKYVSPKYEMTVFETEDILSSSEKYEISESTDGNGNKAGNVIMTAFDLFN
ncbi:MAG: hypothetical protein J6A90_08260 [Clostridia bacterium]|nr:hypothetical protein [Clostridia bacterium]